ncbi:DUF6660 family protein [Flavobacterium rakeshii]|uniref:DUF6660 family protein n=1 Tax=Flavobacterium rakeshii TaxID=1038845 RepID=UPI002E7B961E|nr:DUF6660 family protein [Flavobacterium rakeshii]MEE1898573.1 DUF6660 family protein [Flavobacterium rakeshii]
MQHTKNIVTKVLSVYLLILMFIPCSDEHASLYNNQSTEITQATDDFHVGIEVCTPFCICGSCVAAVIIHQITEFSLFIPKQGNKLISNFYQSLKHDFFGSIWQPPQLV